MTSRGRYQINTWKHTTRVINPGWLDEPMESGQCWDTISVVIISKLPFYVLEMAVHLRQSGQGSAHTFNLQN